MIACCNTRHYSDTTEEYFNVSTAYLRYTFLVPPPFLRLTMNLPPFGPVLGLHTISIPPFTQPLLFPMLRFGHAHCIFHPSSEAMSLVRDIPSSGPYFRTFDLASDLTFFDQYDLIVPLGTACRSCRCGSNRLTAPPEPIELIE